jgi:xylose isomerase
VLHGDYGDLPSCGVRRQPGGEQPEYREYAAWRLKNTVEIGHELGAPYPVYWPGSLRYFTQGAVEETETLKWYAEG